VYTCGLKTGTGVFLLNALQGRSQKMNWPIVHEFHDLRHDDGSTTTAAARTADALRADPDGLAVSTLRNAGPTIKALPFEGILPTPATLIDSAYPLTRATFAFLNRPPNQPPPQPVSEFLRFVFSPEGQSLVTGQPGFLPLSSTIAAEQAAALTPR
jgi:phosphate transport system substrate-binding protein